jgi:hypothetical protein
MERRGFVPKLHLYAHGPSCRTAYSLNYHRGVGRTDGESTERDWAAAVVAALQTSEMNKGSRHGALDDHWCDKNYQRVVGMSERDSSSQLFLANAQQKACSLTGSARQ